MRKVFILLMLCAHVLVGQDFEGLKKINGTNLFMSIKGKGETIVVLHGGPGLNHSYFRPHLNDLEKTFKMVYYDQRASGRSAIPSPDSISINFFVEDLEAIRTELKIEKLNLLAHSWGAVLATHYAIVYPKHVNKIIYSNPAMLSRDFDTEASLLAKRKTLKEDSVARAQLMAGGNFDVSKYDQLMHISFNASAYDRTHMQKLNLNLPANFEHANRALFTGLMKDQTSQTLNLYDSLQKLQFPTLVIHGEADVTPKASVDKLKKSLPKADLLIFTKSGHFPFVEEKEKYLNVVTNFFLKKK